MKYYLTLSCISIFLIADFFSMPVNAQTVLIQENFSNYDGTSATVPVDWTFTYNGNYNSSFITSNCDTIAYRFGINNATITTPLFSDADTVSFWIKGAGIDSASFLTVLETSNNTTWDTLVKINPLPTSGSYRKFAVSNTTIRLRFIYTKSLGNLAFDCFLLTRNYVYPVAAFSSADECLGTTTCFNDVSTVIGGPGAIVSRFWDFGDGNFSILPNPCHQYAAPGNYQVKLTVVLNNNNRDSITGNVQVFAPPSSSYTYYYISGTAIAFTNTSAGSAYVLWDFGDGTTSGQQNPVHIFSAPAYYNVKLKAFSSEGCVDSSTQTLNLTITGIEKQEVPNVEKSANVSPNPSNGQFVLEILDNNPPQTDIKIFNILGMMVENVPISKVAHNQYQIDLSTEKEGFYFIRIIINDEVITKRISISR